MLNVIFSIVFIWQLSNPLQSWINENILVVRYEGKEIFYSLDEKKFIGTHDYLNPDNFPLNQYNKIRDLFIHTGGGLVLHEDNNRIRRIDNSYDHKLQLNSSIFLRNDTVMRFGGYGFFDNRPFITYYDETINEWESYNYKGLVHPKGTHGSIPVLLGDQIFFVGGFKINQNNRSNSISFGEVQEFQFTSKNWFSLGQTKNDYWYKRNTILTNVGFIYFQDDNQTEIINLIDNKVDILDDSPVLRKIRSSLFPPQIFRDTIYFSNTRDLSKISFVSLSNLYEDSFIENDVFLKSSFELTLYNRTIGLVFISFGILFGIWFIVYHRFLGRKLIVTRSKQVYYQFRKLELNEFENGFLSLFFEKEKLNSIRIKNSDVLDLFEEDLDIGTLTRRKNECINILNGKLQILLNTPENIVYSKKSKSDRRNTYYYLDFKFFHLL